MTLRHFVAPSVHESYPHIVMRVMHSGEPAEPRGKKTREITGFTLEILDPVRSLPVGCNRGLNPRIAAVEALQLMGGVLDVDAVVAASPNFREFMDAGTFHGAYGPRIRGQLPRAVERLKSDQHSRQALLQIWDPALDLYVDGLRDYPCTLSLHFLLRNDKLQLHTTMRSNDVWRGLAYDAFQFTQLQLMVAAALDVEAGTYFHHANSMHIYEDDFAAAEELLLKPEEYTGPPTGLFKQGYDIVGCFQSYARELLLRRGHMRLIGGAMMPRASDWYCDQLERL